MMFRYAESLTRQFKNHGLNTPIQTDIKIGNYIDVMITLEHGLYYPFRIPSHQPL